MKSKRTRNRKAFHNVTMKRKAVDLLYEKMMFYNDKARTILNAIIDDMKADEKCDAKTRIMAMKMLKDADEIAIDCAVKLAPFQSPKLESVEVNNKVEHRYVMRAPAQFKNTDEWAKAVGANNEDTKEVIAEVIHPPKRVHISDIDDGFDEIEDQRRSIN